jgi:mRNA interferase MazF
MNEDIYDEWNSLKKKITQSNKHILFKEGEVWWCSVGYNVGTESFGKGKSFSRPVLVLKKLSNETSVCVPLTTKIKVGSWFVKISILSADRYAMLNQIRMFHSKRFQRRMITLDDLTFNTIKEKLKILLELS